MSGKWEDEFESRVGELVQLFVREKGANPWTLATQLIHRGVHVAAEEADGAYCNLAVYLADQIRHAHDLMHGEQHEFTDPPN